MASVLEIARLLTVLPAPRHPVTLLLTDGEEAGLLGAWLFVRELPLSKRVKAAVNLEARGTSGPSLMFETGSANTWLMHLYGSAISRPITNSLYYVVYKQLQNDTDFTVFKSAGTRALISPSSAMSGAITRRSTAWRMPAQAAFNSRATTVWRRYGRWRIPRPCIRRSANRSSSMVSHAR